MIASVKVVVLLSTGRLQIRTRKPYSKWSLSKTVSDYSAKLPSFPAADANARVQVESPAVPPSQPKESIESLAAKMPAPVDPGALPVAIDPPQVPVVAPAAPAAAPAAPPAGNSLQAPAETGQRQYVPIEDPNKPQFDFKVTNLGLNKYYSNIG